MRGTFITVEGPDGAGKTSSIEELVPRLQALTTREILVTREPGGIPIAEEIRKIVLDPKNHRMDERTEALLFAAARRQHLVEKILPALNRDCIVLCDRFVDSSVAYQGCGRKLGMEEIAQLNEFAIDGIQPDLTLYLDVDSETGLQRIEKNRSNEMNRLDMDAISFHQRVRHGYLKLLAQNHQRMKKVDAKHSLLVVVEDMLQLIQENIKDL